MLTQSDTCLVSENTARSILNSSKLPISAPAGPKGVICDLACLCRSGTDESSFTLVCDLSRQL